MTAVLSRKRYKNNILKQIQRNFAKIFKFTLYAGFNIVTIETIYMTANKVTHNIEKVNTLLHVHHFVSFSFYITFCCRSVLDPKYVAL